MTMLERLTQLENKFLDWARSPDADRVATQAPTGRLDDLKGRKYCVLVTYRRNGQAIPSPLWFGVADGKLYTQTAGMKLKRIANNPDVLVAPCTFRGRPLGPPVAGTARVLAPGEAAEAAAERAIAANYGWSRRAYNGLLNQESLGAYVEVTPR